MRSDCKLSLNILGSQTLILDKIDKIHSLKQEAMTD